MAVRIGGALALVAVSGVLAYLFLRPPVAARSALDANVVIECSAGTGASVEMCRAWGDQILGEGAPSPTFEMDDLARLEIDRPALGFSSTCEVDYFISRDADSRAWHEVIACLGEG